MKAQWEPLIRGACLLVALASLVYRLGVVALFLPFAGPPFSLDGAYFLFILAAEIAIFGLSFTTVARNTDRFAVLIPTAAGFYWWFIVCRSRSPIWSDFMLLVIPEAIFAAAVFARSVLLTHNAGAALRNVTSAAK